MWKLEKYEHLTGENLGYKPGVAEQANVEYSSWGKTFNKGIKENDKKEGLLKRLKNIEDINKSQNKELKFYSDLMIKPPYLKSICNKEINYKYLDSKKSIKLFKTLEDLEANETDYKHLVYESDDTKLFKFVEYGTLSNIDLKLTR